MKARTKTARFANNPEFSRYVELLLAHELAIVRGDAAAAEQIADEASDIGGQLSHEENKWLHDLSGDLKLLSGTESFLPSNLSTQDIGSAILLALQRPDAETALFYLRRAPFIPREGLAYFRAQAYATAGLKAVALEFMRYASRLAPHQTVIASLLMRMLIDSERLDEAIALARASAQRNDADAPLLISAAGTLYSASLATEELAASALLQDAARIAQNLLEQESLRAKLDPQEYYIALWALAASSERLGRIDVARQYYSTLIGIDPTNSELYVRRGHLLMAVDEKAALSDYARAVELKTNAPGPYLVLANAAMQSGGHVEARSLASKALVYIPDSNTEARAAALEIMAITSYELGGREREKAVELFERAIRLEPDDERIRRNYNTVRALLGQQWPRTGPDPFTYPDRSADILHGAGSRSLAKLPAHSFEGLEREIDRNMVTPL